MALKDVAAEYFRSMNSMANRLSEDVTEIKTNYENLWESFSEGEKSEIINESIIKPEISLRYSKCVFKTKYEPVRKGDTNYTFKDEHSGPFSFRTISQENLYQCGTNKVSPKISKLKKTDFAVKKKKEEITPAFVSSLYQDSNTIPKTGLDLLDNW